MATEITAKGILIINGKQVEETFNGLSRSAKSLERDLKKLTPGTQEFIDKSLDLKKVTSRLQEVGGEIKKVKTIAADSGKTVSGFFDDAGSGVKKMATEFLSGGVSIKTLGGVIKVFATESWAAIGSIPIIGWIAAIVGGIGVGFKMVLDYNEKIIENVRKLDNFGIDQKVRPQIEALAEYFKLGFDQIAGAIDNLLDLGVVKNAAEAVNLIKIGLVKAPDKNEFISSLEKTAQTASRLGLKLENVISIKEQIEAKGLDSEKVFGSLERSINRISGDAEKIKPILQSSFGGTYVAQLFTKLNTGAISYGQALTDIYKKGEDLKISDVERGNIAKALFGKSASSAFDYNEILGTLNESSKALIDTLTSEQVETLKQVDNMILLGDAKDKALKSDAILAFRRSWTENWIVIKTDFFKSITFILELFSSLVVKFAFVAGSIKGYIGAIPQAASVGFKAILSSFSILIDTLSAGGKVIKDLFNLDFDSAGKSFDKFKSKGKEAFSTIGKGAKEMSTILSTSAISEGKRLQDIILKDQARKTKQQKEEDAREAAAKKRETPDKPGKEKKPKKDPKEKKDTSAEDNQKGLEAEQKAKDALLKLQQDFEDEKFKIKDDARQKDIDAEDLRRKQEIENTKKQKDDILVEIAKLEKEKAKVKSPLAKTELQNAIDTKKSIIKEGGILDQISEQQEQTHRLKLKTINEKWDIKDYEKFVKSQDVKLNADRRSAEDSINNISTMDEAKLALSNMHYLKLTDQELAGITSVEDAKKALRENADRAALAASLVTLEERKKQLDAELSSLSGPEAEKLKADLEALKDKITQVKGAIKGGNESDSKKITAEHKADAGTIDILGFSADQWSDTFKKLDTTEGKMAAVKMAVQALSNAFSQFSQLQINLNQRELSNFTHNQDKKKTALLKQLNSGYITNEQYNIGVQKLEAETDRKKSELALKQAKAQRAAAVAQIAINTAVAIMGVWKDFPKVDFGITAAIFTGILATLGAAEIATVLSTPLPTFATGGFTGSGYGSADASGFRPAGIVHENEYVAPAWMTQDARYANVFGFLENVRTGGGKMYAEGGSVITPTQSSVATSTALNPALSTGDSQINAWIQKNTEFLQFLIQNGVHIDKTAKNGKQISEMLDDWNSLKNKNKH